MTTDIRAKASQQYASVIHRHRDLSTAKYERFASFFDVYLRSHLPAEKSARILDVGCGSGNMLFALQCAGYDHAIGIDASAEQIERATQRGLVTHQADLFAFLAESSDRFDAITLIDVIEHLDIESLGRLLALSLPRLRDGGVLIAHTTNAWSPFVRFYFAGDITHRQCYSPKMLADMALLSGYSAPRSYPAFPEREWSRSAPVLVRLRQVVHTVAWRLISRAFAVAEYVAIGAWHGVYTPNLVFVCRRPAA